MFGIKTYLKTQAKKYLFRPQDSVVFPEKGSSWPSMKFRLWQIKRKLQKRDIAHNLGWLYTLPHPVAVNAYKYFLDQNPNHLGSWTTKESRPFATQVLEREAIWKMIDLYHADKNKIEGYITSGGTESNIFSTWVGRKYLEQHTDRSKICLLATSLTHYSIGKSADIAGIPDYLSPLNPQEWNLDQHGLTETVTGLYKEGYRGFLLPLTLGYTMTGTCDNIEATTKTVQRLQKEMKDAHFFLWIDAALNGFVTPFVDQAFTPFASPLIQTFIVDFHKFGLVPYPAGLVLYRKNVRRLIERRIDYLPEKDNTVLGSRSGVPAANIWAMIHALGKNGYRQLVTQQLKLKEDFIQALKHVAPQAKILTTPTSVSCGIVFFPRWQQRLPVWLECKYGFFTKLTIPLFTGRIPKKYRIYKLFFLPHVTQQVISECISDLAKILKK